MIWGLVALLLVILAAIILSREGRSTTTARKLDHWISSLLKVKENGGVLRVEAKSTPAVLRFRRGSGDDESCEMLVEIARTRRSEQVLDELRTYALSHDLPLIEPSSPGVVLAVRLRVEDIWDSAAGTIGARIGTKVLELLGVDSDEPLTISMSGRTSSRYAARTAQGLARAEQPVVRLFGKGLLSVVGRTLRRRTTTAAERSKKKEFDS